MIKVVGGAHVVACAVAVCLLMAGVPANASDEIDDVVAVVENVVEKTGAEEVLEEACIPSEGWGNESHAELTWCVADAALDAYDDVSPGWPSFGVHTPTFQVGTVTIFEGRGVSGPEIDPAGTAEDILVKAQPRPSKDGSGAPPEPPVKEIAEKATTATIGSRPENATEESAVAESVEEEDAEESVSVTQGPEPLLPTLDSQAPEPFNGPISPSTQETPHPLVPASPNGDGSNPVDSGSALVWGAVGLAGLTLLATISRFPVWLGRAASLLFAGLFSRVRGAKTLEHPVRKAIHALVQESPGITIAALGNALRVNQGTLLFHVKVLARETQLRIHSEGRASHIYPVGTGIKNDERAGYACLQYANRNLVAKAILSRPGGTQKELVDATGLDAPQIHRCAQHLVQAGLIDSHRQGRFRQYFPTDTLQAIGPLGQKGRAMRA